MRKHTRHRRLVRGLGAFVSATLIASGLAVALGGGVASAKGTSTITAANAPSNLQQNTRGSNSLPNDPNSVISGAGAGWTFELDGDWVAGEYLDINVAPNTYPLNIPGNQCATPVWPPGVNQELSDLANYVGFSQVNTNSTTVESVFPGGGSAPTFTVSVQNAIQCSPVTGTTSFATLRLTATNSGNGNAAQKATVHVGWSTNPPPYQANPVLFDVGFGTPVGLVHFTSGGPLGGAAVEPTVNVVGQKPSANEPRGTLVRNTATDLVSGAIPEFKITENWVNALPPAYANPTVNLLNSSAPGTVCVEIQNSNQGNALVFSKAPAWAVDVGASAASNSAAAGPRSVSLENGGALLNLPVEASSNKAPTVWTTTGLSLSGLAQADGPVWARVFWVNGTEDTCADALGEGQPQQARVYELGQVQLVTVSELANTVAGQTADDTAAAAVNHQFDYAKGHCVGEGDTRRNDGGTILLARNDHYADGLGAAYTAGALNSGVLLTDPHKLSEAAKRTIRLQGVQTVLVAGGPLAISDAVVNELKALTAYNCGGESDRRDPNGNAKKLIVERIAGQTLYDTNALLAQYVGAMAPAAFGPFGVWGTDNPFNTGGGMDFAGAAPASYVNTGLLVTGEYFQDAMVASVPAYGGDYISVWRDVLGGPMPLIATTSNSLSPQAIETMQNQRIQQLIVVGGPLAVSDAVLEQAVAAIPGLGIIRVGGQNAVETSTNLASFELSGALGMGWLNVDFDWESYVNRTAGNINFNQQEPNAHVVLVTRGDHFADAMSAAAVLSVHNGRWINNDQKFPLVITESPVSPGAALLEWLVRGSFWVSGLPGQNVASGIDGPVGDNNNNISSSVFTIQPIGGNLALHPQLLQALAGQVIGAGG